MPRGVFECGNYTSRCPHTFNLNKFSKYVCDLFFWSILHTYIRYVNACDQQNTENRQADRIRYIHPSSVCRLLI